MVVVVVMVVVLVLVLVVVLVVVILPMCSVAWCATMASFQSRAAELHEYLLFDDHRVINIGSWEAVKQKCVKSCYQPVLLLYELEADM